MCAVRALRRTWLRIVLGAVLFSGLPVAGVAQSLIEGVDSWTDAVSGRATLKWGGQRVDFPAATPRPASLGHLDAPWGPFSVHAASLKSAARCTLLLTSAQQAADLLALSGLFVLDGDGGQGGTFQRDLYLGNFARSGAFVDGSERASDLDSARAFVLIDERLPSERLPACTSQALIEAAAAGTRPGRVDDAYGRPAPHTSRACCSARAARRATTSRAATRCTSRPRSAPGSAR